MRNFGSKRNWRHVLESKPFLGFLFIIVLIFAWSVWGLWQKMNETNKNTKIVTAKIADLQDQKDNLSSDIAKLKTEPGIEENIREKFGLAKEGEGLIVIVDEKPTNEDALPASTGGFWSFFTNLFK